MPPPPKKKRPFIIVSERFKALSWCHVSVERVKTLTAGHIARDGKKEYLIKLRVKGLLLDLSFILRFLSHVGLQVTAKQHDNSEKQKHTAC